MGDFYNEMKETLDEFSPNNPTSSVQFQNLQTRIKS